MKALAVSLALALCLAGCATIRRHPVLTGVAVALVAGGIALSVGHGGAHRPAWRYGPVCGNQCAFMGAPTPQAVN